MLDLTPTHTATVQQCKSRLLVQWIECHASNLEMWVRFLQGRPKSKEEKIMKPVIFENKLNRERVVCDDTRLSQWVDGVEYLAVHRENSPRMFLMRKDSLQKVKLKEKMAR